jgi:hypothetical protein
MGRPGEEETALLEEAALNAERACRLHLQQQQQEKEQKQVRTAEEKESLLGSLYSNDNNDFANTSKGQTGFRTHTNKRCTGIRSTSIWIKACVLFGLCILLAAFQSSWIKPGVGGNTAISWLSETIEDYMEAYLPDSVMSWIGRPFVSTCLPLTWPEALESFVFK